MHYIRIIGRQGGVYLSYRDLQLYCSQPVIGLLEVFAYSLFFSFCTPSADGDLYVVKQKICIENNKNK